METFYREPNFNRKPRVDNTVGSTFMSLSFTKVAEILVRLKMSRAQHTKDFDVASNTTQLAYRWSNPEEKKILLTKHLLSCNDEKFNEFGTNSRAFESDFKKISLLFE